MKNKKTRLSLLAVIFVVAFFLIKGIVQQPKITNNKEEIERLNKQIALQEKKNKNIDKLKEKTDSDEYIEKVAREELGLVKENEIIFYDANEK